MRRLVPALSTTLMMLGAVPASADDAPWVGGGLSGGAGLFLSQPQTDVYGGPGLAGRLRVGGAPVKWVAPELELGVVDFPLKVEAGRGGALTLGVGARLLPLPDLAQGQLYVDVHLGPAFTGGRTRFFADVGLGFDFELSGFTVGPFVRYQRVVSSPQPTELPGDASIVVGGVGIGFLRRFPQPIPEVAPPAVVAPPEVVLPPPDKCSLERGLSDAERRKEGCPEDAPKAFLSESKKQIIIRDRVYFETASDKILPESFDVLRAVAMVIADHPDLAMVRIEGHTDDVGSETFNLTLSQRRAESVMAFLIRQGVDPARLAAKGYGKTRPLISSTTDEARATNRRVEFKVEASASDPDAARGKPP